MIIKCRESCTLNLCTVNGFFFQISREKRFVDNQSVTHHIVWTVFEKKKNVNILFSR